MLTISAAPVTQDRRGPQLAIGTYTHLNPASTKLSLTRTCTLQLQITVEKTVQQDIDGEITAIDLGPMGEEVWPSSDRSSRLVQPSTSASRNTGPFSDPEFIV